MMFAKRLAVGILLVKSWDFRSIAKMLKMSLTTIGSVNYWINHRGGVLKKQIEKIIAMEQSEEADANLWAFLEGLVSHGKGQNWGENRRRIEEEKRRHHHVI